MKREDCRCISKVAKRERKGGSYPPPYPPGSAIDLPIGRSFYEPAASQQTTKFTLVVPFLAPGPTARVKY